MNFETEATIKTEINKVYNIKEFVRAMKSEEVLGGFSFIEAIVKIQQSLHSSDQEKHVLIYDESRRHRYETADPVETQPILQLLKGRPKAYFNAEVKNTKFEIGTEVESQNW